MKKNNDEHYFKTVLKPGSGLLKVIGNFGFSVIEKGRIPLEVFIKRDFGSRYLSFLTAVLTALGFAFTPIPFIGAYAAYNAFYGSLFTFILSYLFHFLTWYVFIGAYLYFAWKRRKETKLKPNQYSSVKFSYYHGELIPWADQLLHKWHDIKMLRIRETLIEPGLFFLTGMALLLLGQYVGFLVMGCSVMYSFSYLYEWHKGDEYTQDMLDKITLNRHIREAFIKYLNPSHVDGVQFRTFRPDSEELRSKVSEMFMGKEEEEDTYVVS